MSGPPAAIVDLEDLALARGGGLLIDRAAAGLEPGARLVVRGRDPELPLLLAAYCRSQGHALRGDELVVGVAARARHTGAERAGAPGPDGVVDRPAARWGLAARGALVQSDVPAFPFSLATKDEAWADEAPRLYAQAAAAQWDPATAIPWAEPITVPDEIEDAVVQVMTYLVENEAAALIVPARFLAQVHPHFREVMQLLAVQAADEARHLEVFTRRALLRRTAPGLSAAGGQESLRTLLEAPDFAEACFLLSVLGEGSFLALLQFLHEHAPDPVTAATVRLAGQDEARHVAFGVAHLRRHATRQPALRSRLAAAAERRHQTLRGTAGLGTAVFEALVLLAAGSWEPAAVGRGWQRVLALEQRMDDGRRQRLERLGFSPGEAETISAVHTRNFM